MNNNLILNFLFRMFLSIVIVTTAVLAGFHYYYKYEVSKIFMLEAQQEIKKIETKLKSLSDDESQEFLKKHFQLIAQESSIVTLEVFDNNHRIFFSHKSNESSKKELDAFVASKKPFELNRRRDSWLLLFNYSPYQEQPYTIIGALKLSEALQEEINDTLQSSLYVIVITSFMIMLLLFPMILRTFHKMQENRKALFYNHMQTIEALGNAIAERDSDTNEHNYRVAYYTFKTAEVMQFDTNEMRSLILGAFLHDVGKIGIPDAILLKPGKLNNKEFEIMKTHVQKGLEIVGGLEWLKCASRVIAGHHEKFDGSGYPLGLKGTAIPIEARIFAVVDVFDALCSQRPYKKPIPLENVLEILKNERNTHFDPQCLDAFFTIAQTLYAKTAGKNLEALRNMFTSESHQYFLSDRIL